MHLKKVLDLRRQTLRNATMVAFLYAACTKLTSHERLGIYLSCYSELTKKFINIIKRILQIGENYTCPPNKLAYV